MSEFFLGLDLGQPQDYTALCVVERLTMGADDLGTDDPGVGSGAGVVDDAEAQRRAAERYAALRRSDRPARTVSAYHLRHLERPPRETPYAALARRVCEVAAAEPLAGRVHVVADVTGVGRPALDLLRPDCPAPVTAVTVTGADEVAGERGHRRVPKRDLVTGLQVLFGSGRLKLAAGLDLADALRRELQGFSARIVLRRGDESPEAWREREYDDLVLAVAVACWYAEHAHAAPSIA